MIEMAFEMASNTRKSLQSGLCCPVKGFDAVGRCQIERLTDRAHLQEVLRRKSLKVA
jgi:hypothetical protein